MKVSTQAARPLLCPIDINTKTKLGARRWDPPTILIISAHTQWLTWVFASSVIYIHLEILHVMTFTLITTSRYKATPKAFRGLKVYTLVLRWVLIALAFAFILLRGFTRLMPLFLCPLLIPLGFLTPHSGLQKNFGFSLEVTPACVCCGCCVFAIVVCFLALR